MLLPCYVDMLHDSADLLVDAVAALRHRSPGGMDDGVLPERMLPPGFDRVVHTREVSRSGVFACVTIDGHEYRTRCTTSVNVIEFVVADNSG